MPMYNMCLTFDTNCNFIFDDWLTNSAGGLAFGVILTFIFSFITVGFSHYKDKFAKKNSPHIYKTGTFLLGYLLKLITMFLVMTMNFFVCMAVVIGMTTGQLCFDYLTKKRKSEKLIDNSD